MTGGAQVRAQAFVQDINTLRLVLHDVFSCYFFTALLPETANGLILKIQSLIYMLQIHDLTVKKI